MALLQAHVSRRALSARHLLAGVARMRRRAVVRVPGVDGESRRGLRLRRRGGGPVAHGIGRGAARARRDDARSSAAARSRGSTWRRTRIGSSSACGPRAGRRDARRRARCASARARKSPWRAGSARRPQRWWPVRWRRPGSAGSRSPTRSCSRRAPRWRDIRTTSPRRSTAASCSSCRDSPARVVPLTVAKRARARVRGAGLRSDDARRARGAAARAAAPHGDARGGAGRRARARARDGRRRHAPRRARTTCCTCRTGAR